MIFIPEFVNLCIVLIDLGILNHPYIPEINPTYL